MKDIARFLALKISHTFYQISANTEDKISLALLIHTISEWNFQFQIIVGAGGLCFLFVL